MQLSMGEGGAKEEEKEEETYPQIQGECTLIELKCKMMTKRTTFEETFDFPPSVSLLRFKINSGHTQTDVTLSFLSFLHMSPPPPPPAGGSQVRSCSFDFVGPIRISKPKRQRPLGSPSLSPKSFTFLSRSSSLSPIAASCVCLLSSSSSSSSLRVQAPQNPQLTTYLHTPCGVCRRPLLGSVWDSFQAAAAACCGGSYKIK